MGCKLFFISDGEINGSFKRNEDASSSGPNRVNIPLTSLNAPKARSIAGAAVKALEKKKDLRSRRIYSSGLNCIASASQFQRQYQARLVASWRPLGSANTPRSKTNRLERGDTFAETEKIFYICIEIGKHSEHIPDTRKCAALVYVMGPINNRIDFKPNDYANHSFAFTLSIR